MQDHYTSEYHMKMVPVISKLYCYQSEEEVGQTIDQFCIEHETFWSRAGSFATSYILESAAIKDRKLYLWHNMYVKPLAKVLVLVGCQVTPKILGIGPFETKLEGIQVCPMWSEVTSEE